MNVNFYLKVYIWECMKRIDHEKIIAIEDVDIEKEIELAEK